MIAVTFALPQESQNFVRALDRKRRCGPGKSRRGWIGGVEVLVAHTGVGEQSAAAKIAEVLAIHQPKMLINAGFAGALDRRLRVADLLIGTEGSTRALVEKCRAASLRLGPWPSENRTFFGRLVTRSSVIESVEAKAELWRATGALGVDMESGIVAEACAAVGLPFLSIRVVSDRADQPLPVPMEHWFDLERQKPKSLALLRFLVQHPSRIVPFASFVSGLPRCRKALNQLLIEFIRAEARPSISVSGPARS